MIHACYIRLTRQLHRTCRPLLSQLNQLARSDEGGHPQMIARSLVGSFSQTGGQHFVATKQTWKSFGPPLYSYTRFRLACTNREYVEKTSTRFFFQMRRYKVNYIKTGTPDDPKYTMKHLHGSTSLSRKRQHSYSQLYTNVMLHLIL